MFRRIKLKYKIYIACFAWLMGMIYGHPDMDTTFACGIMFIE